MAEDSSEFGSITSSQKSYLKNCPFANPGASPTKSTDSNNTEVLGNQISPAVVKTPILSFSSPTSLDSINDDVFRTPPENASLSSAPDSEPRVRVSEIKGSNLKSPSSNAVTTPVSASPSLPAENVRVSEIDSARGSSNLKSPSSTATTTPLSSSPSEKVRVLEIKGSDLKSPSSNAVTMPLSSSPSEIRVLETNSVTSTGVLVPELSSPSSIGPGDVRVLGKSDSFSPDAIGRARVSENQPISDSVANNGVSKSPVTENSGGDLLPFREIIEALLRNSGEKLNERDENVSYVDILKRCGLKFP